jgi:hypothetical protein
LALAAPALASKMTEMIIARCITSNLCLLNGRQSLVTFSVARVRGRELQIGKPGVTGNIPSRATMSVAGTSRHFAVPQNVVAI